MKTIEELQAAYPIGSLWRIKEGLHLPLVSKHHPVREFPGHIVKINSHFKSILSNTIKMQAVLRLDNGEFTKTLFGFKAEWLEPIEEPRNETFDQMYRRKMDENLRSIFG